MQGNKFSDKTKSEIDKLIQSGWDMVNTDNNRIQAIASKVLDMSQKYHYEAGTAQGMLLQAAFHNNSGAYAKALQFIRQASEILDRIDDIDGKIRAEHVMGFMNSNQANLEEALSHYQKGLRLIKENGREVFPAFLNNIAVIYFETGKVDEAMAFYREALEIAEKQKSRMQGLILSNLAEAYLLKEDTQSALECNSNALDILQNDHQEDHFLASCYNMFGLIYSKMHLWESALVNFEKSLQIYQDAGQKFNEALQLIEIGRFYVLQQKFTEAASYLHKAVDIGEESAADGIVKDACKLLSQSYENLQDYKSAYEYITRYYELNEKIKTRELSDRLDVQMTEFKIDKAHKDAEIERLKNIELKRQADENARIAEIMSASYMDIKIIGEIGQKLTATLDFKKVNNMIYKNIHKLMDADVFGICLYNEDEKYIDFRMYIENEKKLPLYRIQIDNEKSLAAECIRTKREICLNEADDSGRILVEREGIPVIYPKSIMYYPLLLGDRVIGAITVQSAKINAYNERTMQMLKALASYIAIALYNSQKSEELRKKTRELEHLSKTDALTGIFNRRFIMDMIDDECHRYDRAKRPFCVVVLDIDHFKSVNDMHGHSCGDYVLINLAKILKSFMRKQDTLARWGGEEFLIVLPDTDLTGALALCERMRKKIDDKRFVYHKKRIQITATFGVAQYNEELGIDAVINNADKALYTGKNNGRNCVVAG